MVVFVPDDPSAFPQLLQTTVFVVLPLPRTRRTYESSSELSSHSVKGVREANAVASSIGFSFTH